MLLEDFEVKMAIKGLFGSVTTCLRYLPGRIVVGHVDYLVEPQPSVGHVDVIGL